MPTIFCPQCHELILDQPACPACGWQRPLESGDAGKLVWQAELGHRLAKPRCYPVIAAGRYCAPTEDGAVVALDLASGERAWERILFPIGAEPSTSDILPITWIRRRHQMTTTIEAVFDGKVLRLDRPLNLAPNTRVRVTIEPVEPAASPMSSFLRTARSLNLNAPPDLASNVDEYLYGEMHDDTV